MSALKPSLALLLSMSLGLVLGANLIAPVAHAAEGTKATKDNYQYLDYGATGSGGEAAADGGPSSAKKAKAQARRKAKDKKSEVEVPTWQQAFKELAIPAEEQSTDVQSTPATVRTNVDVVESPVARPSYELGLSIEPYRPAGRVKLSGFESYELDSLGTRPMPALEFRWLPTKFEAGRLVSFPSSFGVYASAAYIQHPVGLVGPTGESLPGTHLSTLKWQAGGAWAMLANSSSPWGGRLEAGVGELRLVQASSSALANHSASESFASIAVYGERRVWSRVSAFVGYDHRFSIGAGADEIELSGSNFKVGISGGFN